MKSYVIFNRKILLAFIVAFLSILLICCELYSAAITVSNAKTDAERIAFIKSLGFAPLNVSPSSKSTQIPDVFSAVYENYNELQLLAGYDLRDFKGCEVTIFSYFIETPDGYSGDTVFNIIVYNNRVIGGDVSSRELGGFMLPITK